MGQNIRELGPNYVNVKMDIKKAYNSILRAYREAAKELCPKLLPSFDWEYGGSTNKL